MIRHPFDAQAALFRLRTPITLAAGAAFVALFASAFIAATATGAPIVAYLGEAVLLSAFSAGVCTAIGIVAALAAGKAHDFATKGNS